MKFKKGQKKKSDTFPFLTNCISASMIHTTNLSVESKRTGIKDILIPESFSLLLC